MIALCVRVLGAVTVAECGRRAGIGGEKAARWCHSILPAPTHQHGGRRKYYTEEEAAEIVAKMKEFAKK